MRCLMACTVFPPAYSFGGPPRTNLSTAQCLLGQGHSVLVVTTNAAERGKSPVPTGTVTAVDGVDTLYLNTRFPEAYYYVPELRSVLGDALRDCDVCIVKGVWTHFSRIATQVCKARQVACCVYPEGTIDAWAMRSRWLKKSVYWQLFERSAFRRATGFIAASADEQRRLRELGFTQPSAIIPNVADISARACAHDQASTVQTNALPGKRVVLFMARLHPKKNLETLLRAYAVVRKQCPDSVLVVAGSGPERYEAGLRRLCAALGLEDHTRFVGFLTGERMIDVLQSARVFVLPSRSEGLPLAVQNALACGVPAVVSAACNMPEVSEAGAGFVVQDPDDVSAIARSILALLSDDALHARMSEAALGLVAARYSLDAVGRKTAAFLGQLCGKPGRVVLPTQTRAHDGM